MTFNEFSKEVISNLQEYAGTTGKISMREITKNNGLVLHGITWMREEMNCSPTIYLDSFYENFQEGMEMSEIMMKLIRTFENYTPERKIDMSFFTDYTQVKDKIILKLIGYEQNRDDSYDDGEARTYVFSKNSKYYYAPACNAFLNIGYRF